ncbi:MAG: PLDc_N domain-containing protein [Oscillospiraceae bacterium]|nr:PLDc_N domain-containing protein [Oscillospiraceae bacterium]
MNKLKQFVYSKRFIAGIFALFQLRLFFFLTTKLYTVGSTAYTLLTIFSILIMLYILEKDNMNPSYKIIWIIIMVFFPVSGALIYFLFGDTKLTRKQQ